ncbi:MFS transporter [Bacillus sp. FJAT-45350]|uniref:MFS transporter n=1 Tax=Bacillus sp. FJAT-45350 TaxID=2011014 RepID=UPI000BB92788|nr:MFS transporter [Bacillus sp. FJAT-45350]
MIELRTKQFWKASVALGIASFLIFANVYFTQPLLPLFSEEFSVSPVVSSLSISLVLLTLGICFTFYSIFSNAIGRKVIMVASMIVGTIVTFLIAFAPNYEVLLAFRVIQAIALAGIPTIAMTYIGEEFSVKALTLAVGIYISANTIGGMGGRLMSGIITDLYDWRMAFIGMGILSFIMMIVFIFLLPPSKHFIKEKINKKVIVEQYRSHLRNRTLRYAYIVGGLHFFLFVGVYNFITYLLSGEPFHVSTTILGFLFITYIAGTFSSTYAGKVSQTFYQSTCIGIGILIMVVGLLLTLVTNLTMIFIGLLCLSFGFFFAHSCSSAWVGRYATKAKSSASGIYLTSYYLCGSLGSFYFAFFWNAAGWIGVIVGAVFVLIITTYCMFKMYQIENSIVTNSHSKGIIV